MVQAAEELARDLKFAKDSCYKVTDSSLEKPLKIPSNVARKLAKPFGNPGILYRCSGCPEWHIRNSGLPDGVTRQGFIALMKLIRA
jgi:hypothetical protein